MCMIIMYKYSQTMLAEECESTVDVGESIFTNLKTKSEASAMLFGAMSKANVQLNSTMQYE